MRSLSKLILFSLLCAAPYSFADADHFAGEPAVKINYNSYDLSRGIFDTVFVKDGNCHTWGAGLACLLYVTKEKAEKTNSHYDYTAWVFIDDLETAEGQQIFNYLIASYQNQFTIKAQMQSMKSGSPWSPKDAVVLAVPDSDVRNGGHYRGNFHGNYSRDVFTRENGREIFFDKLK